MDFSDVMDPERWNQRKFLRHLLKLYQVMQESEEIKSKIALPRFANLELIEPEIEAIDLGPFREKIEGLVVGLSKKISA